MLIDSRNSSGEERPLRHLSIIIHVLMRDAEGRKKEASKVKQTQYTQGSHFS